MQVNDPVTLAKRYLQWSRLSATCMSSRDLRQMIVNFDFLIKRAEAEENS